MSRSTYVRGFVKAAEARGVDPLELVGFMKRSSSFSDTLSQIGSSISQAWKDVPKEYKPLVSGLVGAAGGAGIGALGGKLLGFGAGRGALAGFGLGGIGGALYGSHAAGKQYGEENDQELAKRDKAHADAVAGLKAQQLSEIAKREKRIAELDESMGRASETINKNEGLISRLRESAEVANAQRKADNARANIEKTRSDTLARDRAMTAASRAGKAKKQIASLKENVSARDKSIAELRDTVASLGRDNQQFESRIRELESMGIGPAQIAAMSDAELAALPEAIKKNLAAIGAKANDIRSSAKAESDRRAAEARKQVAESLNTAEGILDSSESGRKSKEDLADYYAEKANEAMRKRDYKKAREYARQAEINAALPADGRVARAR